jgi:MYND finger
MYDIAIGTSPLVCATCNKVHGEGNGVRRCSTCCVLAYCGVECQRQHRQAHKGLCRTIAQLRTKSKEIRDSGDVPAELSDWRLKVIKLLHDIELKLAHSMLRMVHSQTDFDPRSYEIVLRNYIDFHDVSSAGYYKEVDCEIDRVVAADPRIILSVVVLPLIALNRNDDAMTVLNTAKDNYSIFLESEDLIRCEGERMSAFDYFSSYHDLNLIDHACLSIVRARFLAS